MKRRGQKKKKKKSKMTELPGVGTTEIRQKLSSYATTLSLVTRKAAKKVMRKIKK